MATDNIFKFVSLRPPYPPKKKRTGKGFIKYDSSKNSPLHDAIKALKTGDLRSKAKELAEKFIDSGGYNPDLSNLANFFEGLDVNSTPQEARTQLEKELGAEIASPEMLEKAWDNAWDSLYAQTLLPEKQPEDRDNIYAGIKALNYVKALYSKSGDSEHTTKNDFSKATPLLPNDLIPKMLSAEKDKDRDAEKEKVVSEFKSLYRELTRLQKAREDVKANDRTFRSLMRRSISIDDQVDTKNFDAAIFKEFELLELKQPIFKSLSRDGEDLNLTSDVEGSFSEAVISVPATKPWIYQRFGKAKLKKGTQEVLKSNEGDFSELEASEISQALHGKMYNEANIFFKGITKSEVSYISNLSEFEWVATNLPTWTKTKAKPKKPTIAPGSPTQRGIQPLGIGDLLVVKQELQKYTAGEVAHIENVLSSEKKNRKHSRMRETEEIEITETETIEENERDLQSTERFELHKEAQKTIDTEMSVESGVSVTASYGVVEATAHGNFAFSKSQSESIKNASDYAKTVVDKSVSKIIDRARTERTRRSLERFEEINEHGFDNSNSPDHKIGIYRWVDKHYKARVINYGKRLMMEFIVPEPAAFYIHTEANQESPSLSLTKPEPPLIYGNPLKPTDLTKYNYTDFVSLYSVQDVEAFPDQTIRISTALAGAPGAGGKKNVHFSAITDKLTVPAGYQALDYYAGAHLGGYKDSYYKVFVAGRDFTNTSLYGIEGIIPVSVNGWAADFSVTVVVKCELKAEGEDAWQIKTFESIMNAYNNALAAYNEEKASAEIQAGVSIQGRNPDFNRKIEEDELRKSTLRMLTNNFGETRVSGNWRFNETFNAMHDGGQYGYPEFNVNEAQTEGKIIQFFEQAFEWNNMTYRFYPYFWGRKDDWDETFSKEDTDPNFTDFLRAGAARVVIPAHPAYTEAVLHYLHTKEIWNGGEPPVLDDPLFISIVDEIKADTDADLGADLAACDIDSGYPCLSDEWDVKVPTNLVYLQEDSDLPDFTEDQGN